MFAAQTPSAAPAILPELGLESTDWDTPPTCWLCGEFLPSPDIHPSLACRGHLPLRLGTVPNPRPTGIMPAIPTEEGGIH